MLWSIFFLQAANLLYYAISTNHLWLLPMRHGHKQLTMRCTFSWPPNVSSDLVMGIWNSRFVLVGMPLQEQWNTPIKSQPQTMPYIGMVATITLKSFLWSCDGLLRQKITHEENVVTFNMTFLSPCMNRLNSWPPHQNMSNSTGRHCQNVTADRPMSINAD